MNKGRSQVSTEESKLKEKQNDLKTKVISKHGNFTLNEKAAIQKKIKSCKNQSLVVKLEKRNNLRFYYSKTAFEKFSQLVRQLVRSIQENTNLEHVENEDQKGQVYSEILSIKDKSS